MENEKVDIYKNVTLNMWSDIFVDIGIIGSLFFCVVWDGCPVFECDTR